MKNTFTAIYKKTGKWYSAWVEEIPGVNTQGKTLAEARENLRDAIMFAVNPTCVEIWNNTGLTHLDEIRRQSASWRRETERGVLTVR